MAACITRNKMIQQKFAEQATAIAREDTSITGLAVGGSWLSNETDEFSDLDLILVTKEKVSADKEKMLAYAKSFGSLLNGFIGDHVGEPRLLICLYKNPLLHVDIKFLTIEEFGYRVETPVILFDRDGQLQHILNQTTAQYPYPDYQWIEDRFWIWVHYALLKIGRGEYFEAMDFLGFLRMVVFGPLLHIKNDKLPRGIRKVEMQLDPSDLEQLKSTIAQYDRQSLITALENAITIYRDLRKDTIIFQKETEKEVMEYLQVIRQRSSD
jgi:predicted nucleotidyltransferase